MQGLHAFRDNYKRNLFHTKMRADQSVRNLSEFVHYLYTRLLRDTHRRCMFVDKTVTLGSNNEDVSLSLKILPIRFHLFNSWLSYMYTYIIYFIYVICIHLSLLVKKYLYDLEFVSFRLWHTTASRWSIFFSLPLSHGFLFIAVSYRLAHFSLWFISASRKHPRVVI